MYCAAVAACAAVLGLRVGITWLKHRWRRERLEVEPLCATCGYIVAHRASPLCPECGRDVREYGLITSRARPRIGIGPLYVLFVLLALPLAIWFGFHAARWQPLFGWRYFYSQAVALSRGADGSFGPPRYAVQSEGRVQLLRPYPEYVLIYCNTDFSGPPMLAVDIDAKRFSIREPSGRLSPAQPITASEVARFLRSQSPEVPDAQIMVASERIVSAVSVALTGSFPGRDVWQADAWNGTYVRYSVSDGVVGVATLLAWPLLSVLLFGALSRFRQYRLRRWHGAWREEAERLGLVEKA